jgi:hypothetical protein
MFLTTRIEAGGSVVFFGVPPFRNVTVSPTIDAAVGLAFDLLQ